MQNVFAVDLYRRLGGDEVASNLFFSPYSVFQALAMTAEGASGETAEQMGQALRLPSSLHRQGPEAAARPWDFDRLHVELSAQVQTIERRDSSGPPEARARIETLRAALAAANEAAERAGSAEDWSGARKAETEAGAIASELNTLLSKVDRYELRLANSLWGDGSHPFDPRFMSTIAAHYGTGSIRSADFRGDAETERRRINAWAADQTAGRIRDLLPPDSVDALTRLVLANAIYFKGEWTEVFESRKTQNRPFRLADGGTARVPLMGELLGGVRYGAFRADGSPFETPWKIPMDVQDDADNPKLYPGRGGFQTAELSYKGGDLSMVVLLPESPTGLAPLEEKLTADRLATWTERLKPRGVYVLLPKFKLEQGGELSDTLRAMGMERAFVDPATGRGAQFDGMTASTNPDDALYVSKVFHKAFLEVNEKGTEAAAATTVVAAPATAAKILTRPFVPTFRADRPFLFLIRDIRSGSILFMGRFARP